jgi:hypothetical protein
MTDLLEVPISSLNDFLDAIRDIGASSATETLWYRGSDNADHALIPRLYRSSKPAAASLVDEGEMLAQFRSRSQPLVPGGSETGWGAFFIMQHYGVPTRLLDWSENALVALYFAVSLTDADSETDAAVWVLDPAAWNGKTFPGMESPGRALHVDHVSLNNYGPERDLDTMAEHPAAIYGRYNNPRITAQRGVFTVFGRVTDPLEKVSADRDYPEKSLVRLRLSHGALADLRNQVRILGFRESMVYPDLSGLAAEIRTDRGLK